MPIIWARYFFPADRSSGALIFGLLAAEIAEADPRRSSTSQRPVRRSCCPSRLPLEGWVVWLHGCCRGVAVEWMEKRSRPSDGIPRHPIAGYEIAFDLLVGGTFVWMVRKGIARGQLFSIFLMLYGGSRFATEFIREKRRNCTAAQFRDIKCSLASRHYWAWHFSLSGPYLAGACASEPAIDREAIGV